MAKQYKHIQSKPAIYIVEEGKYHFDNEMAVVYGSSEKALADAQNICTALNLHQILLDIVNGPVDKIKKCEIVKIIRNHKLIH